jgi:hypothetical protein
MRRFDKRHGNGEYLFQEPGLVRSDFKDWEFNGCCDQIRIAEWQQDRSTKFFNWADCGLKFA